VATHLARSRWRARGVARRSSSGASQRATIARCACASAPGGVTSARALSLDRLGADAGCSVCAARRSNWSLAKHLTAAAIWLAAAIFILHALQVALATVVTGASFLGVAVALVAQDLLRDCVAGFCGWGSRGTRQVTSGAHGRVRRASIACTRGTRSARRACRPRRRAPGGPSHTSDNAATGTGADVAPGCRCRSTAPFASPPPSIFTAR